MYFRGKKQWVYVRYVLIWVIDIRCNMKLVSEIYPKVLKFSRDHRALNKY